MGNKITFILKDRIYQKKTKRLPCYIDSLFYKARKGLGLENDINAYFFSEDDKPIIPSETILEKRNHIIGIERRSCTFTYNKCVYELNISTNIVKVGDAVAFTELRNSLQLNEGRNYIVYLDEQRVNNLANLVHKGKYVLFGN
jgi:hypothetical protein